MCATLMSIKDMWWEGEGTWGGRGEKFGGRGKKLIRWFFFGWVLHVTVEILLLQCFVESLFVFHHSTQWYIFVQR